MNEQWNTALDQVADEFLLEAARYQRRRYWPGVVAAAAAVLAVAVGWSVFKPQTPPEVPDTEPNRGSVNSTAPPELCPPTAEVPGGLGDFLIGGNDKGDPSESIKAEPPVTETLDFATYSELRSACLNGQTPYLHQDVPVPILNGQPLEIEDITVFEKEMYNVPWVWYFISHTPHITVRIPTMPELTADLDPDLSGAEALRQISPDAPNLHNREAFADSYSEIREVPITTSEGVKIALYRQEAHRDRGYLTFLQNGTLVTVSGPRSILEGNWPESFCLVPINRC